MDFTSGSLQYELKFEILCTVFDALILHPDPYAMNWNLIFFVFLEGSWISHPDPYNMSWNSKFFALSLMHWFSHLDPYAMNWNSKFFLLTLMDQGFHICVDMMGFMDLTHLSYRHLHHHHDLRELISFNSRENWFALLKNRHFWI